MSSGLVNEDGTVEIGGAHPFSRIVWNKDGEIIEGGHNLTPEDYTYLCCELSEQFCVLSGRVMQLIEAAGLPDKQERSLKRFAKKEIYERLNDIETCMFEHKRGEKFSAGLKPMGGMPPSEE